MERRERDALTEAMDDSARRLTPHRRSGSVVATLQLVIESAIANVPGVEYAGVTVAEHHGLSTRVPTDPRVDDLDRAQEEFREGPCITTLTSGETATVLVDDFAAESRWPRFSALAIEHGVRSLMSFAMSPAEAPPASVNLYATRTHAFGAQSLTVGAAFATQAAIALYGARVAESLEKAIETRDVIGQAKGILMERYDIDADAAFERMVEASQHANIKLVEVARWLAATRGHHHHRGEGHGQGHAHAHR